jgi:ketosteroid isomerase-like protein
MDDISVLEHEANRAFLERDLKRLDELFSDELLVNSPINRVNDKKTILELLGKGIIGHVSTTIHPEVMRQDGDVAIVMGWDEVQNAPAEPVLRRRYTNVWRKEKGRWRLYIRHATIMGSEQFSGNKRTAQ